MNKLQRDTDSVVVTEGEQLSLNKKKKVFKEKRKHLSLQASFIFLCVKRYMCENNTKAVKVVFSVPFHQTFILHYQNRRSASLD